ncbi:hypothetical protein MY4824_008898 [Beauveria thailandica]
MYVPNSSATTTINPVVSITIVLASYFKPSSFVLPFEHCTMTVDENAATDSPCSSSTWSGPRPGQRSFVTFDSSLESNPYWREPGPRLERWKQATVDLMESLWNEGGEGKDIVKGLELHALRRGWRRFDIIMNDGSPLPEDLGFWKARAEQLQQELIRIKSAKGTWLSIRDTINPRWGEIYLWMINIERALRGDTMLYQVPITEKRPSDEMINIERALRGDTMLYQVPITEKRPSDSIDGGDKDDALPSKRSKRNPPNDTTANASRPNTRKATVAQNLVDGGMAEGRDKAGRPNTRKATVAQNLVDGGMAEGRDKAGRPNTRKATIAQNHLDGGMAESRDKAGAEQMRTARQPLRRSPRIAALEAAKAANMKKKLVGRPPATTATTTAAKS